MSSLGVKSLDQTYLEAEEAKHQQMLNEGLTVKGIRYVGKLWGKDQYEVTYEGKAADTVDGKLHGMEKACKVAKLGFGAVVTFGIAPAAFSSWKEDYSKVKNGTFTRTETYSFLPIEEDLDAKLQAPREVKRIVDRKEAEAEKLEKLGYDPTDQDSVIEKAKKLKEEGKLRGHEGHPHTFYLDWASGSAGYVIFCPNGDVEKARAYQIVDAKTGKPISDPNKAMLGMYDFCMLYSKIQDKYESAAIKLSKTLNEGLKPGQRGYLEKDQIIEELKKLPIAIDATNGDVYIHSHANSGLRSGIKLDAISKDTWKAINRAHNKRETKAELNLKGFDPYKNESEDEEDENSADLS